MEKENKIKENKDMKMEKQGKKPEQGKKESEKPVKTPEEKTEERKAEKKVERPEEKETKKTEKELENKEVEPEKKEEKPENKEEAEKKKVPQKVEKKEFAIINAKDKKISTKHAIAICNFIRYKPIEKAISELEMVIEKKIAIPMKGEIPHRKGMAGGRYPIKACKEFIIILKSLSGNCVNCKVESPIIATAKADLASRPYRRGGSRKFKRTHVTLIAREKQERKNKENPEKVKQEEKDKNKQDNQNKEKQKK
jgi:ribosomal protein L22